MPDRISEPDEGPLHHDFARRIVTSVRAELASAVFYDNHIDFGRTIEADYDIAGERFHFVVTVTRPNSE